MYGVAILGFGVVGSGVAEVLDKNAEKIARNAAQEIRLKYIVDVRDFPGSPYEDLIVKDFAVVEADPEVHAVVETIGGVGVAYDFTKRSLRAGKSVITSNKELVAQHGYELLALAREHDVNYLFEASVGGGIPILRPITQCLSANKIHEIFGILNGTTNYILTEMIENGMAFEDALADAQRKGYAEQNPAADIEGGDACRKICILSDLCFGRHIDPACVQTEGIVGVTLEDVKLAARMGYKIKLLGRAVQTPDEKVCAYVAPHLVRDNRLLSGVDGVMNGIVVRGNAIGDVMFYGAGAGKLPTASAVVADVIDAARHQHKPRDMRWDAGGPEYVGDAELLETPWFVRCGDKQAKVNEVFGPVEYVTTAQDDVTAFKTPALNKKRMRELTAELSLLSMFRIID